MATCCSFWSARYASRCKTWNLADMNVDSLFSHTVRTQNGTMGFPCPPTQHRHAQSASTDSVVVRVGVYLQLVMKSLWRKIWCELSVEKCYFVKLLQILCISLDREWETCRFAPRLRHSPSWSSPPRPPGAGTLCQSTQFSPACTSDGNSSSFKHLESVH